MQEEARARAEAAAKARDEQKRKAEQARAAAAEAARKKQVGVEEFLAANRLIQLLAQALHTISCNLRASKMPNLSSNMLSQPKILSEIGCSLTDEY